MKRQGRTPTINRSSNELKGKEKARTLNSRRRLVKGDGMEGFGDSSNAPKKSNEFEMKGQWRGSILKRKFVKADEMDNVDNLSKVQTETPKTHGT